MTTTRTVTLSTGWLVHPTDDGLVFSRPGTEGIYPFHEKGCLEFCETFADVALLQSLLDAPRDAADTRTALMEVLASAPTPSEASSEDPTEWDLVADAVLARWSLTPKAAE